MCFRVPTPMLAGLSMNTLYVELAHHYMFGTTEDSCFCNPRVCYGYDDRCYGYDEYDDNVMDWI